MMYCKICDGGHKNIYEEDQGAPLRCSVCGRNIMRVAEKLYIPENENSEAEGSKVKKDDGEKKAQKAFEMSFQSTDGTCVIPVNGETVVGRNSSGKEYLEKFCDVSRAHFTVTPRPSGIAATIKDSSKFGTYINGTKMPAGSSAVLTSGATVGLATDAVLKFIVKEVE